jgi:hypothetical protein
MLDPQSSTSQSKFTELTPHRTELRIGNISFILDTSSRRITRNGSDFARFDRIKWIDVTHMRAIEDRPECWSVQLNTGPLTTRSVLVTTDDADASIVGARLSAITGKRVRSL